MNHALTVNKNVYFIGWHVKEPRRFDKLKSLVHHCSRIDGNFCAHAPVGMLERLLDGDIFQVIACSVEERTAGSSQNKTFDALFSGASLKRLEYCGMFAVDRENRHTLFFGAGCDKLAAGDKSLLVGEGNIIARLDSGKGRLETGYADNTVEHLIGIELSRDAYALFAAEHFCIGIGDFYSEFRRSVLIGDSRYLGLKLPYLLFEQVDI